MVDERMNSWLAAGIGVLSIVFIVMVLYKTQGGVFYGRYDVDRLRVIEGDEFDILLENGRRLHAELDVEVAPEGRVEVIRYLNDCLDNGGHCVLVMRGSSVDLLIVQGGTETSLTSWLRHQGLVWDDVSKVDI